MRSKGVNTFLIIRMYRSVVVAKNMHYAKTKKGIPYVLKVFIIPSTIVNVNIKMSI